MTRIRCERYVREAWKAWPDCQNFSFSSAKIAFEPQVLHIVSLDNNLCSFMESGGPSVAWCHGDDWGQGTASTGSGWRVKIWKPENLPVWNGSRISVFQVFSLSPALASGLSSMSDKWRLQEAMLGWKPEILKSCRSDRAPESQISRFFCFSPPSCGFDAKPCVTWNVGYRLKTAVTGGGEGENLNLKIWKPETWHVPEFQFSSFSVSRRLAANRWPQRGRYLRALQVFSFSVSFQSCWWSMTPRCQYIARCQPMRHKGSGGGSGDERWEKLTGSEILKTWKSAVLTCPRIPDFSFSPLPKCHLLMIAKIAQPLRVPAWGDY